MPTTRIKRKSWFSLMMRCMLAFKSRYSCLSRSDSLFSSEFRSSSDIVAAIVVARLLKLFRAAMSVVMAANKPPTVPAQMISIITTVVNRLGRCKCAHDADGSFICLNYTMSVIKRRSAAEANHQDFRHRRQKCRPLNHHGRYANGWPALAQH